MSKGCFILKEICLINVDKVRSERTYFIKMYFVFRDKDKNQGENVKKKFILKHKIKYQPHSPKAVEI